MDDDGRSGRGMAGGGMGKLTHLEAFLSDDAKRGRVWRSGQTLFRRNKQVLEFCCDGKKWTKSLVQSAAMDDEDQHYGPCHWADEPKTLTPQDGEP